MKTFEVNDEKIIFYMMLSSFLLEKFCNSHIEISKEEWDSIENNGIKHRINPQSNKIEFMVVKPNH